MSRRLQIELNTEDQIVLNDMAKKELRDIRTVPDMVMRPECCLKLRFPEAYTQLVDCLDTAE